MVEEVEGGSGRGGLEGWKFSFQLHARRGYSCKYARIFAKSLEEILEVEYIVQV